MGDLTGATWRKSTRSGNGGSDCVEVADNMPEIVAVRDSKDSTGPALIFPRDAWVTFVESAKAGDFDPE